MRLSYTAVSEPKFKMELFAKIVNDWKPLTIFSKKNSILEIFDWVLKVPLMFTILCLFLDLNDTLWNMLEEPKMSLFSTKIVQKFPCLTLPAPCMKPLESNYMLAIPVPIAEEKILNWREKTNSNFYFHTSLWCHKRFYEDLKSLHKTFRGNTKCEKKILSWFFLFVRDRNGKG